MDNYMNFDKHVENLCTKSNGLLYILNRQKHYLNATSRICVVEALIKNLFSYCSIIWSTCNKSSIAKIQKVQNFAAKVADGNGKIYEHATLYIKKFNWLKINETIHYNILMFVFSLT